MIKKISVFLFLFFFATTIKAQQASSSPYSFYGIGDVRFKGTAENRLMGTVSVFPDSIHVNIQNPASYSSLKMTTYSVGGSFNASKLNSFKGNDKAQRTTLDYLAVGIPLGKSGIGFGLIPYSSVGYRIKNTRHINGTKEIRQYEGSGGLNKVFVGYGYKVNANLSLGIDANYNFGRIETKNVYKDSIEQLGTQQLNISELNGFNVNVSAMYQKKINKKLDAYASLVYSPESNLKSKNSEVISSVIYTDLYDPIDVDQLDETNNTVTMKLPSKLALGFGIGEAKKWMVGTELTYQQSSKLGNRSNGIDNVTYKNAMRYSFGGYYIPNYSSFSSYFKKVTYRAGFRYENTGLVINKETIRDYAVSAGFGLPLGGAFSNLNLGIEYGRRGTAKALLIEENYTNVIMSFSLNDRWFIKRKYN